MSKELARGRVGLNNLGNSCFMNAALQCLLHAPEFVYPFLETDENPIEGQTNNKYKMVREFAKLARLHYSNSVKSQNPQQFRKSVKSIASYLCDGDQHDSHEFMNYVLQGLEEELNKHSGEPVTMENNYIPDYTMDAKAMEAIIQEELFRKAKEWWGSYKRANDCFITDALYGEICNCIRCTECSKCTYNYSSFNTLYVPVKRDAVTVTVTLVVQQFDAETSAFNIQYFAIPISVRASDPLKMLEMRLRERLSFSVADAVSTPAPLDASRFSDCKILFLAQTVNDRSLRFDRPSLDRSLADLAAARVALLAYLVPPQRSASMPVFLHLTQLAAGRPNGSLAEDPLESRQWTPRVTAPPVLFTLSRDASLGELHQRVDLFLRACQERRVYSTRSGEEPSKEFQRPFARVPVAVDYFFRSPFFPTADMGGEVSESPEGVAEGSVSNEVECVAECVVESTPESTPESTSESLAETVAESTKESTKESMKEPTAETIAESNAEPMKETTTETTTEITHTDNNDTVSAIAFPRVYLSSLREASGSLSHLSSLPLASSDATTPLRAAFDFVDARSDYRCVLAVLGLLAGEGLCLQQFRLDGERSPKKLYAALRDTLFVNCPLATLQEETEASAVTSTRAWGKTRVEESESSLTLADCIELKKTTTVMLSGRSVCQHCHRATALETTPFLARLPPLLFFQLKRFKYAMSSGFGRSRGQSFGRQKINTYVEYPLEDLDMTPYLLDGLRATLADPQMAHYELLAVVNHSGTADFGHYFAYCRDGYNGGDNWFEYNDSSVSAVRETDVVSKNAYVLLYRRKDLGRDVYSRLSAMNVVVPGKKLDVSSEAVRDVMMSGFEQMKKGMEKNKEDETKKLERPRNEGIDNERKDGVVSTDSTERRKKRLSATERKELKRREKEEKKNKKNHSCVCEQTDSSYQSLRLLISAHRIKPTTAITMRTISTRIVQHFRRDDFCCDLASYTSRRTRNPTRT